MKTVRRTVIKVMQDAFDSLAVGLAWTMHVVIDAVDSK